jgi:DNA-directed RNA polymerase subunit RPC12/RpoP
MIGEPAQGYHPTKYHCHRCGHDWVSLRQEGQAPPTNCARCKNRLWAKKRVYNIQPKTTQQRKETRQAIKEAVRRELRTYKTRLKAQLQGQTLGDLLRKQAKDLQKVREMEEQVVHEGAARKVRQMLDGLK